MNPGIRGSGSMARDVLLPWAWWRGTCRVGPRSPKCHGSATMWCPPTLSLVERNMPSGTPITPLIIVTNPKMRATLQNNNLLSIGVCGSGLSVGFLPVPDPHGPANPDSQPYLTSWTKKYETFLQIYTFKWSDSLLLTYRIFLRKV